MLHYVLCVYKYAEMFVCACLSCFLCFMLVSCITYQLKVSISTYTILHITTQRQNTRYNAGRDFNWYPVMLYSVFIDCYDMFIISLI